MIKILIADDEKLERTGIKFLLKREPEEFEILEAENGKAALGMLAENKVDILFSDIKMPYMTGLELSQKARELYPDMEIVIFSGYNDFSYARDALRYGVVDYVLKPVNPAEFHDTFQKVMKKLQERADQEEKQNRHEDYLKKYFFQNYLYTGNEEEYKRLLEISDEEDGWIQNDGKMVLVSCNDNFFETEEEHFIAKLKEQIGREFYYLNLNSNESLFLFREKYTDYERLAQQLYKFFSQQYDTECYFAFDDEREADLSYPEEFQKLEKLLEEQFYQPKQHVFIRGKKPEDLQTQALEDSELMEHISSDIKYRDVHHLRQDYQRLSEKYGLAKQYSEMYVKFVFSSIIKELLEAMKSPEKELAQKVDKLYRCRKLKDVLEITEQVISDFEREIQEENDGSRKEVSDVKSFIYHNYDKDLSVEQLAKQVYLSSGYLSAVFKEETGMNLNRFIREVRMKKAKEMLENTNKKITQIAKEVGFVNNSYFCRSFREFFGETPEACRRGNEDDQKITS